MRGWSQEKHRVHNQIESERSKEQFLNEIIILSYLIEELFFIFLGFFSLAPLNSNSSNEHVFLGSTAEWEIGVKDGFRV
jgi:hypothetical protein